MTTLALSKMDVARRQLRVAIDLWFLDGDPVSTYGLAYAAHEIVHALFRKKGHSGLLFDSSSLAPDDRKRIIKELKDAANFFKHANNDSDAVLTFDPQSSELFIFHAIVGIAVLGETLNDTEAALLRWYRIHKTHLFPIQSGEEHTPPETLDQLRRVPKRDFYEAFLEVRRNGRKGTTH